MNEIFLDITLILILAGLVSFFVSLFKQPTLVGYIITGLIVGPLGYYKLHQGDAFSGLSQIGITLLLFIVGLELDITQLKKVGKNILLAGIGQMVITTILIFCVVYLLRFPAHSAWYIALLASFSSTIVAVKLLSEKKDLQSLYGKLSIGISLIQDLFALVLLIVIGTSAKISGNLYSSLPLAQNVLLSIARGLVLVLFIMWLSAKVFPKILKVIGKNDELLFVFALAWALGLAAFVSTPIIGFSLEIGGFLAGLSLASSSAHYEISARVRPLRDFFIIIFFIVLGSSLQFSSFAGLLVPAIVLLLAVLVLKPLVVMVVLGLLGYKPRTSFFTGNVLVPISEFSFIVVTLGLQVGLFTQNEAGLIILVGLFSIAISSYSVLYTSYIYEKLKFILKVFDFRKGSAEKNIQTGVLKNHIILIGAHRLGHHLIEALQKQKGTFVVVDFNPEVVEDFLQMGLLAVCGDITDPYIQEELNLQNAKLIISTVPDIKDNLALLDAVKKSTEGKKTKPKLIFIAQDETEIKALYEKNIDYVISPHFMGGLHLAKILEGKDVSSGLKKLREHHLKILSS